MKRHLLFTLFFSFFTFHFPFLPAQTIRISDNGRFLQYADGTPFFYMGDTAWELFHRLNREEADEYLHDRAAKGFNVIQCVALAELDGVGTPNAYGHLPLIDRDPSRPLVVEGETNDYWDHVDYIVHRANELGLTIALLPTWGRWWHDGDAIFDELNAYRYGRFLGERYCTASVIWVLGGDRNPENDTHRAIMRALASGLGEGEDGVSVVTQPASIAITRGKTTRAFSIFISFAAPLSRTIPTTSASRARAGACGHNPPATGRRRPKDGPCRGRRKGAAPSPHSRRGASAPRGRPGRR